MAPGVGQCSKLWGTSHVLRLVGQHGMKEWIRVVVGKTCAPCSPCMTLALCNFETPNTRASTTHSRTKIMRLPNHAPEIPQPINLRTPTEAQDEKSPNTPSFPQRAFLSPKYRVPKTPRLKPNRFLSLIIIRPLSLLLLLGTINYFCCYYHLLSLIVSITTIRTTIQTLSPKTPNTQPRNRMPFKKQ